MSLWKRFFGKHETESDAPPSEREVEPAPAADASRHASSAPESASHGGGLPGTPGMQAGSEKAELARLRRVGRDGGMQVVEAVALLRHHSGSARQTQVLAAALDGLTGDPQLDPLRVACAVLLEERGDRERAKRLVARTRSVAGMMLAAELHALTGNLAHAVSTIERVLARNIDTPGARERHTRWSRQLGRDSDRESVDDGATMVAPDTDMGITAYRLIREVARGGAGTIYEAEDEILGRRLAFKVYHRADREQIAREARTAVRLAGPGVLRIYDADPSHGWLASEWIGMGSLREILRGGRLAQLFPLRNWLPRLVTALGRVHDGGMVHADIKPANVLFRSLVDPVLGDFGVCVPTGADAVGGTPGYMSPERLAGARAHPQDDVYALGRIIEDVLGARDDAELDAGLLERTGAEAGRYAEMALVCLSEASERPADALAVAAWLATGAATET